MKLHDAFRFGGFRPQRGDLLGQHVRIVPPSLKFGQRLNSTDGVNTTVTGYAVPGGLTRLRVHHILLEDNPDYAEGVGDLIVGVDVPNVLPPKRDDPDQGVREVAVDFRPFSNNFPFFRVPPGAVLDEEMLGETVVIASSVGRDRYFFDLHLWGHHEQDSGNETVKNVLAWWRP